MQPAVVDCVVHLDEIVPHIPREQRGDPLERCLHRRSVELDPPVFTVRERNLRKGQCNLGDEFLNEIAFVPGFLEKFPTHRHVEEQVTDLDQGAPRCSDLLAVPEDSPFDHDLRAGRVGSVRSDQLHPRYRGDAGKSLPAETHGSNGYKVLFRTEL